MAVGATGVAGTAGALPMRAGATDLPKRLACASEGMASEAMVRAITPAVVRKEMFTRFS